MTWYFCISSATSRNSVAGLQPKVHLIDDETIVKAAFEELARAGKSLEVAAGVPFIEDEEGNLVPARQMTPQEILATSVEVLESDGRLFEIYTEAADFLEAAARHHLEDEARDLVELAGS